MPTYEYRCTACEHRLEVTQGINEAELTTCPECGAERLDRLISRTSFALKGSGWYSDGYSDKKGSK